MGKKSKVDKSAAAPNVSMTTASSPAAAALASTASKKKKATALPPTAVELPASSDDDNSGSESDEEDEETGGVDERGMKRLMDLLGDDGLDEFGAAQLDALADGADGSDSEEDDSGSEGDEHDGSSVDEDDVSLSDEDSSEDEDEEEDEEEEADGPIANSVPAADDDDEEIAIDEEDDISLDEDAVPKQKIVINNKNAMKRIRESIQLDPSFGWVETLSLTYGEPLNVTDPDNDLERELAFYKQALSSAQRARTLSATSKPPVPFTRPADYYAEMVKSDSHMERIRQKLLDEKAGIAKSEDARRQRELKKVGKQVQVEKMKERVKGRKEMDERLKGLKRKRGGGLDAEDDDAFDVAVEDAISDKPARGGSGPSKRGRGNARMPRSARDSKFGFGSGKGRRDKQNTRESANDVDAIAGGGRGGRSGRGRGRFGGGGKGGGRGGGAAKRPGKARRQAGRH